MINLFINSSSIFVLMPYTVIYFLIIRLMIMSPLYVYRGSSYIFYFAYRFTFYSLNVKLTYVLKLTTCHYIFHQGYLLVVYI